MPRYRFKRQLPDRLWIRTFKCAITDLSRLTGRLESLGWVRIYDPPAAVISYLGMAECMDESRREAEKQDQAGWSGITDV